MKQRDTRGAQSEHFNVNTGDTSGNIQWTQREERQRDAVEADSPTGVYKKEPRRVWLGTDVYILYKKSITDDISPR